MLDTSFAQACLVVTAAAVLMGRNETLTAARFLGKTFGRMVGTLQGYRSKYEHTLQESELFNLQSDVRKELTGLRDVSYDMNMISSNRLSYKSTDTLIKKKLSERETNQIQREFVATPVTNTDVSSSNTGNNVASNNVNNNNHDTQSSSYQNLTSPAPTGAILPSSPITTSNNNKDVINGDSSEEEMRLLKLARMMLAEDEIRLKYGDASVLNSDRVNTAGAQNRNNNTATTRNNNKVASGIGGEISGVDIIQDCISESIMNHSYQIAQQSQKNIKRNHTEDS